jgi:hypothetical protein
MDEVNAKYMAPYFNATGGPNRTGFKGTLFPLALTRDQVYALYWKLVSVELSYEVNDTDGIGSSGKPYTDAEVPEALLGSDTNTAIIKRVCGGLEYLSYVSEYYLPPPADPSTFYQTHFLSLFDFRTFWSGGATTKMPRCIKIENVYYPLFEWEDTAYEAEATTFGIETYATETTGGGGITTIVITYSSGPTVTLAFPDSSTASFQTFLRRKVITQPPASGVPPRDLGTLFTAGTWNVNLW